MTEIYVGVSNDHLTDQWALHPGVSDACELMKILTGAISVGFVCNGYGGIYPGDVYSIILQEDDVLFFLIRTGLDMIDSDVVQKYKREQSHQYWDRALNAHRY